MTTIDLIAIGIYIVFCWALVFAMLFLVWRDLSKGSRMDDLFKRNKDHLERVKEAISKFPPNWQPSLKRLTEIRNLDDERGRNEREDQRAKAS